MKRIILLFALFASVSIVSAQWIQTSIYKNNYWTNWKSYSGVAFWGSYSQLTAKGIYDSASCYTFRLTINNFFIPSKSTRKQHISTNTWYEYTGTIEYWIDDEHMNFLTSCDGLQLPTGAIPCYKTDGTPSIIKKSSAKIQIAPYKTYPDTYNVWFENIGFAFSMCGQHF